MNNNIQKDNLSDVITAYNSLNNNNSNQNSQPNTTQQATTNAQQNATTTAIAHDGSKIQLTDNPSYVIKGN